MLTQVGVTVEYEQQECGVDCQQTFSAHIYEISSADVNKARNTDNYRLVTRIVPPDTSSGTLMNTTFYVNFFEIANKNTSFYLAFQDEGSCMVIRRLIVFYHVCPQQTVHLVRYPETIAPFVPSELARYAFVSCVENAVPDFRDLLVCAAWGIWAGFGELKCHCSPGYIDQDGNGSVCIRK